MIKSLFGFVNLEDDHEDNSEKVEFIESSSKKVLKIKSNNFGKHFKAKNNSNGIVDNCKEIALVE